MIYVRKIAGIAAIAALAATSPVLAQSAASSRPAAQSLSVAASPALARNLRAGAALERESNARGNTFGYILGAVAIAAFVYGAIEIFSDDDDSPVSP